MGRATAFRLPIFCVFGRSSLEQYSTAMRPRLFLITPFDNAADRLVERVGAALAAGDVATLLIDAAGLPSDTRQNLAKSLVQACHQSDVAALVRNDTQLAGRCGADGVHIDGEPDDLDTAIERFRPQKIVGAGRVTTRHDALLVGDMDVDYVFFGRVDRDEPDDSDDAALSLAEWWSPIIEIPCVAMAGKTEGIHRSGL